MPVAARFHTIRDRVTHAVDKVFAEPVKLSFLLDDEVDPERQAVEIEAVLRVGGGKQISIDSGRGQTWRTQIAVEKAELHIVRAHYQGPMPKKGDRVRALSRPGEPWFEVLRVDDRSEARLILELGIV